MIKIKNFVHNHPIWTIVIIGYSLMLIAGLLLAISLGTVVPLAVALIFIGLSVLVVGPFIFLIEHLRRGL